jgi:4-amino-4-deoxy-L-arabinose transferase-like glycosyltransferase
MSGLDRWLRRLDVVIVAVVFCAPFFVGLGRNDLAGDEAPHACAAERMIETGDWLNRIATSSTDIVFLRKPPLMSWLMD